MGNAPFPNPADASDEQIVLAVRALVPLVARSRHDVLSGVETDAEHYLACVFEAVWSIVATECRKRADLILDDELRELLDEDGDGDDVAGA
jgi:hypothetical protein